MDLHRPAHDLLDDGKRLVNVPQDRGDLDRCERRLLVPVRSGFFFIHQINKSRFEVIKEIKGVEYGPAALEERLMGHGASRTELCRSRTNRARATLFVPYRGSKARPGRSEMSGMIGLGCIRLGPSGLSLSGILPVLFINLLPVFGGESIRVVLDRAGPGRLRSPAPFKHVNCPFAAGECQTG